MKKSFISRDAEISNGKLCFTGTRIPVYIVLELLEAGESWQKILNAYPSLTKNHIHAALHYAVEVLKNQEYYSFA